MKQLLTIVNPIVKTWYLEHLSIPNKVTQFNVISLALNKVKSYFNNLKYKFLMNAQFHSDLTCEVET
jgi:hypothetical protein